MPALPDRTAEPRMSDYDAEKAGFRLEVPEVFNPVIDIVERWAAEAPDDLALVSLDGAGGVVAEQTAADLALESRRAARALLAAGIGKGDRVFIMLPRVPAWYTAMLGAIRIGAVVLPGAEHADAAGHRLPDRHLRRGRRDHRRRRCRPP